MGIDRERWNLLAFSQPKMPPGFARVGGLVNSVADGKIRALQSFTTGDIHDIRIRRSNRNRADGLGWLSIKNRVPGAAIDRKSTRLNSSHTVISYAVFCLKKKK